jgi:hypothetical protein
MNERTIDFRYAPRSVWTCIGRPDDPYKSLVREDGALLYEFTAMGLDVWRFGRVYEFDIQTDRDPLDHTQTTESARVPIVTTQIRYPQATLTLQAFGHAHDGDRRTDVVLWTLEAAPDVQEFVTFLRVTARSPYHSFAPPTLAPGCRIYASREEDRPPIDFWATVSKHNVEPPDVQPSGSLAFVSAPHALRTVSAPDYAPASGLGTALFALKGGKPERGVLFFPQNHGEVADFDLAWADAALAQERTFWQQQQLQPRTLQTPDSAVNEMLTACARNILQAREIEAGLPVFKVGPTVYRNLFIVDGHFFLEAAQYLGHAEDAAEGLATLLRQVQADGSVTLIPDHNKETGIALATLVRQSELSGLWDRLRAEWPRILAMVEYIRSLRRQAYALDPADVAYGLMPPGYCDGGLGGKRPEYSTALWTLFGLKEIARAAELLGFDDDAVAFQRDFDELMRDFRRCAARDLQTLEDGTPYLSMRIPGGSSDHDWIPDYPLDVPPWQRINPGTGTWALAQAIYPGELFAEDDALVQNFLRLLAQRDAAEGIPEATGWLPYRALWPYAASFYAHAWLYAGRPEKAIDYLYAFANHAASTRVWREEQSLRATGHGQYFGDMPHNWASVEFIRLVRNLLVFERGQQLELLYGLPPQWLRPHKALIVEATPTRFGPVSVRLEMDDQVHGQIAVVTATQHHLVPTTVLLRLPDASRLTEVIHGRIIDQPDDRLIKIPADTSIRIRFERA